MIRRHTESKETAEIARAGEKRGGRKRLRMSYIWALLFLLGIGAWMYSGEIIIGGRGNSASVAETTETQATAQEQTFRVRVRTITAAPREGVLILHGRTEADARVQVRAETSGIVEDVPVRKGAWVAADDVLCRIETAARKASLAEANAALAQAEADAKASSTLVDRGYASKLKVAADQAKLDAARAGVEKAELELDRTLIRAPFGGIVEDIVEVGDYLNAGGMMIGSEGALMNACALLVKFDPLLVVGHVSEREVGNVERGQDASVRLVSGETVNGKVRFVSASADQATRTFRVEVEVPNPGHKLRDGVTAEIHISLPPQSAHLLTPAILTLNEAGEIGVRAVDKTNRVNFLPVRILSDGPQGVYVAGLPHEVRVITVGQDYVAEGALVEPVEEDLPATAEAQR